MTTYSNQGNQGNQGAGKSQQPSQTGQANKTDSNVKKPANQKSEGSQYGTTPGAATKRTS